MAGDGGGVAALGAVLLHLVERIVVVPVGIRHMDQEIVVARDIIRRNQGFPVRVHELGLHPQIGHPVQHNVALAGMVGVVGRDLVLLQERAIGVAGAPGARLDHRVVIIRGAAHVHQGVHHGIALDEHAGPDPLRGLRAVDGQSVQIVTIIIGRNIILDLGLAGRIAMQLDRLNVVVDRAVRLGQLREQIPVVLQRRAQINMVVVRALDDIVVGLRLLKAVRDAVAIRVRDDRHSVTVVDAAVCEFSLEIGRHAVIDVGRAILRIEQACRHRVAALIRTIGRIAVVIVEVDDV